MGLATLMGSTTWAVASVSIWLVPAYLALMIGIFAIPGARGVKSPAKPPTTGSDEADVLPSGEGSGSDCADWMNQPHPVFDPSAEAPAGEAAEFSSTRVDPAGSLIAKPRRSRARSRKAAKAAAEPASDTSPVTWIRVGPGQFVRADGRILEPPPATAEEVTREAHPETNEPRPVASEPEAVPDVEPMIDGHADVPSVSPPTVFLEVPADTVLHDSPESPPVTEWAEPSTVENPLEPSAEEYGIAPSAFGPETEDSPASPSLVPDVSDESVVPFADPDRTTDLDGPLSNGEFRPDRPGLRRPRWWVRAAFFPQKFANVSLRRRSNATSSRRGVRTRLRTRTASGRWSPTDLRLRQAARRASGRTDHVQRDWRPRSPPCYGV
jgi:hypothetical protein